MKVRIAFIGAGKMAEGIVSAMDGETRRCVAMADKSAERRGYMAERYGVETVSSCAGAVAGARLVFFAVRPQDAREAAGETAPFLPPDATVVSILAGKTLASLRGMFPSAAGLVRVMPNLALRAKAGMCALCAAPGTPEEDVEAVERMLSAAGRTIRLEERHFDAATALSGSGPAYFAYMQKSMQKAGEALGLPAEAAALLSAQTMLGTAKFLDESKIPLDPFIDGVCTKGGTTAAGMEVLASGAFDAAVRGALGAAAERSARLGAAG